MLCHYSFGEKPDLRSPDFMDKRAILDRIKKHRESKYDGRSHDHTLDKVRAHEEHRMNKMKEILETRRTHLQEHAEGTRVLTDEEHAKYTRQVNNFQRKLDERSVMSDHVSYCDNCPRVIFSAVGVT